MMATKLLFLLVGAALAISVSLKIPQTNEVGAAGLLAAMEEQVFVFGGRNQTTKDERASTERFEEIRRLTDLMVNTTLQDSSTDKFMMLINPDHYVFFSNEFFDTTSDFLKLVEVTGQLMPVNFSMTSFINLFLLLYCTSM